MVSHPFLLRSALSHYCIFIASLFFISLASWSVEACSKESTSCVQVQVNNVKNNPLENMVVYLEPLAGQVSPQQSETVSISQHSKSFIPYISVSQSTTKVNFVNKDDITHHIYSADSENKFSFKIRAGKTDSTAQFNHAAEIAMGCNIHDWMSGYLLVVDTPYFAKTDEQGLASFTLNELGKYRVVVWHPQMRAEDNRMIIEKDILTGDTITFTLQQDMNDIPVQKSDDDFDFLSDY
jgi:plastocyanin